jgi:hypothetical protein
MECGLLGAALRDVPGGPLVSSQISKRDLVLCAVSSRVRCCSRKLCVIFYFIFPDCFRSSHPIVVRRAQLPKRDQRRGLEFPANTIPLYRPVSPYNPANMVAIRGPSTNLPAAKLIAGALISVVRGIIPPKPPTATTPNNCRD